MKGFKLLLIGLFSIIAVSCSDSTSNNEPMKELFPLKIGNKWTYQITKNDSISTSYNDIQKDTVVNGETWYIVLRDGEPVFTSKNKSDGMWIMFGNEKVLFYKYPATLNDEYMAGAVSVKVVSLNKQITVPAGTFECIQYHTVYSDKEEYDEFFCPGTGTIKIIAYEINSGVPIINETIELVSKDLK